MSRICPHCQESFTPTARGARGRGQVSCGRPPCVHIQSGVSRKGHRLPRVSTTLRRLANERIRTRLRGRFGRLTAREVELFRFVWKTAHKRGYDMARRHA